MVKVTEVEGGYRLGEKILFGDFADFSDKEVENTLCLAKTPGDAIRYGKEVKKHADFPGEYDIEGTTIKCIHAGDMLHYIITLEEGEEVVALIQSVAALEKESIDGIDTRLVSDASIQTEIENLELEGDVSILGATEDASDVEKTDESEESSS